MKIKTYTKKDIANEMAKRQNKSVRSSLVLVDDLFSILREYLTEDSPYTRIEIRNFGVFESKPTKAKPRARNPRTNEEIYVPAHKKTRFKPGKIIKAQLRKPIWAVGRILGVDYGDSRIGLAISDLNKIIASPFHTIHNKDLVSLEKNFKSIILENDIECIVLGLPISMSGSNMLYLKGIETEKIASESIISKVINLVEKKAKEIEKNN